MNCKVLCFLLVTAQLALFGNTSSLLAQGQAELKRYELTTKESRAFTEFNMDFGFDLTNLNLSTDCTRFRIGVPLADRLLARELNLVILTNAIDRAINYLNTCCPPSVTEISNKMPMIVRYCLLHVRRIYHQEVTKLHLGIDKIYLKLSSRKHRCKFRGRKGC